MNLVERRALPDGRNDYSERRLLRRSTDLVAFSLSDSEDRDSGEWLSGTLIRRSEDRASWERHGDALRWRKVLPVEETVIVSP